VDDTAGLAQFELADSEFRLRYAGFFLRVKKACEPIHVQLDLSSYQVDVVNTTTAAVQDASLGARVYSLENKLLLEDSQKVQAGANALSPGFKLELAPLLSTGMVFVRLTLNDAAGKSDFG